MPKTITQIRADKVLDTKINYSRFGIITRREYIERLHRFADFSVKAETLRNYAAEQKETDWLSHNAWSHPWGNSNHPQAMAYNARKEALRQGIYKTEYRACYPDGCFSVITKIEFDYFNTL